MFQFMRYCAPITQNLAKNPKKFRPRFIVHCYVLIKNAYFLIVYFNHYVLFQRVYLRAQFYSNTFSRFCDKEAECKKHPNTETTRFII